MIKEVANYIETELPVFVIGAKLQVGHWNESAPNRATLLLESGGTPNEFLSDRKDPYMLQVLSRAETYMTARDDAYSIYNLLHLKTQLNFESIYEINVVSATSVPQSLGEDDKGRFLFTTNYIFRCRKI